MIDGMKPRRRELDQAHQHLAADFKGDKQGFIGARRLIRQSKRNGGPISCYWKLSPREQDSRWLSHVPRQSSKAIRAVLHGELSLRVGSVFCRVWRERCLALRLAAAGDTGGFAQGIAPQDPNLSLAVRLSDQSEQKCAFPAKNLICAVMRRTLAPENRQRACLFAMPAGARWRLRPSAHAAVPSEKKTQDGRRRRT